MLRVSALFPLDLAAPFLDEAIEACGASAPSCSTCAPTAAGTWTPRWRCSAGCWGPSPCTSRTSSYRDGRRRWASLPRGGLAPHTPAAALIGAGTYSSGEALAYHFQAQRRGPLVGRRTPGAADHVTPIVLGDHVRANLPHGHVVDAVTGANWEQTGVRPDVPCEEAGALERALGLLRAG